MNYVKLFVASIFVVLAFGMVNLSAMEMRAAEVLCPGWTVLYEALANNDREIAIKELDKMSVVNGAPHFIIVRSIEQNFCWWAKKCGKFNALVLCFRAGGIPLPVANVRHLRHKALPETVVHAKKSKNVPCYYDPKDVPFFSGLQLENFEPKHLAEHAITDSICYNRCMLSNACLARIAKKVDDLNAKINIWDLQRNCGPNPAVCQLPPAPPSGWLPMFSPGICLR